MGEEHKVNKAKNKGEERTSSLSDGSGLPCQYLQEDVTRSTAYAVYDAAARPRTDASKDTLQLRLHGSTVYFRRRVAVDVLDSNHMVVSRLLWRAEGVASSLRDTFQTLWK